MYGNIPGDSGNYSIKNYSQTDYQSENGRVLKTKYTVTFAGEKFTQTIYDLNLEKYSIEIVVTDNSNGNTNQKMAEFILNSITINN